MIVFGIYIFCGIILSTNFKSKLEKLITQKEIEWILSIFCLLILSSYYVLIIQEMYFGIKITLGFTNLFFIVVYAAAFFTITILSILVVHRYYKNQNTQREFQHFSEYVHSLETTNVEIRKFRHDYKNILLTLEGYLDDKNYDKLDQYFRTVILPTIIELDKDSFKISKVVNIEISELKSMIVNKVLVAQHKGIDTIVEVPYPIKRTTKDFSIILIRSLGIILDNAIEAASEINGSQIKIALLQNKDFFTIIVENTCQSEIPPVHILKANGFSTKGEGKV